MCQTCAKLVDNDQSGYTIDKLLEWKSDSETAAARALERRRSPESEPDAVFLEAERRMPELIAEMREDVRGDDTQLIREIVILYSRNVRFGGSKPRFLYFETEHPHLRLKIDWLEEMGFLVDITPGNTPLYRMVPEFIDALLDPT